MWFKKFEFAYRKEALNSEIPSDFFTQPISIHEIKQFNQHSKKNLTLEPFLVTHNLKLPKEYVQLLNYSNGGTIVNGEREFGYFDCETIREFYIQYEFFLHASNCLPIAFNGGGVFYFYRFENDMETPQIFGVHASCVGYEEDTCYLGETLEQVLKNTKDIEDEIYEYQVNNGIIKITKPTKEQLERADLNHQLKNLEQKKNAGQISLKEYLINKKELKKKLKQL